MFYQQENERSTAFMQQVLQDRYSMHFEFEGNEYVRASCPCNSVRCCNWEFNETSIVLLKAACVSAAKSCACIELLKFH